MHFALIIRMRTSFITSILVITKISTITKYIFCFEGLSYLFLGVFSTVRHHPVIALCLFMFCFLFGMIHQVINQLRKGLNCILRIGLFFFGGGAFGLSMTQLGDLHFVLCYTRIESIHLITVVAFIYIIEETVSFAYFISYG